MTAVCSITYGRQIYSDLYKSSYSGTLLLRKGDRSVENISKSALVLAIIVAALLLLFGGGMMTGTTMSGGMMGNGSMGGISWMWLPTLLVVILGVVLFSVLFRKK